MIGSMSDGDPFRSVPLAARAWSALLLLAATSACSAYLLTALTRLDLDAASWLGRAALIAAAALLVLAPLHGSLAVFFGVAFFGNHPGGHLMELLDVAVAACTLGLVIRAVRLGRPAPGGRLWRAVGLLLLSAGVALIPALPAIALWGVQTDSLRLTLVQTLTASETVPLYSAGSWIQLLLTAGWAYALCWAGADRRFAMNALRCVTLALLVVMALGILDYHGAIDLRRDYMAHIETPLDFPRQFQSVFWNPGWFAWYFTVAFGLSLGLLWSKSRPWRGVVAVGLAVCYLYFLANGQRGGFIALHAVLLTALVLVCGGSRRRRRWLACAAGAAVLTLVAGFAASHAGLWPERFVPGLRRLLTLHEDPNRQALWVASLRMWRSAPLLGLGEGTFGWRLHDFVPAGSPLERVPWGDAHNTWLQLLAARGLVGLSAYLALLLVLARGVTAALREAGERRVLGLALAFGLIGFVTYSFVQYMFYLEATQVLFWGMVALTAIASPGADGTSSAGGRRWATALLVTFAVCFQVAANWAGFAAAAEEAARQPRGFYSLQAGIRRWSSRRGTVCLYPSGPVMTVELGTSDPRARVEPVTVSLSLGPLILDRVALRRGATARTYFLPEAPPASPVPKIPFGDCVAGIPSLPLTVEVDRLWSPKSYGSWDGRIFGVTLFAPTFRAVAPADELGFYRVQTGDGRTVRWMGARASLVLPPPAADSLITVPVRAPGLDPSGPPVEVAAFVNRQRAAGLSLRDGSWRELRAPAARSRDPVVLTLQVERPRWRDTLRVANAYSYVALQVGEARVDGIAAPR